VAVVVLKSAGSMTGEDVLALFQDRLARYKHPRDVVFTDTLPRNAMGKVLRFELRKQVDNTADN
jgi:fatty-acyl-CoA synthase